MLGLSEKKCLTCGEGTPDTRVPSLLQVVPSIVHESTFKGAVRDRVETAAPRVILSMNVLQRFFDGPFNDEETCSPGGQSRSAMDRLTTQWRERRRQRSATPTAPTFRPKAEADKERKATGRPPPISTPSTPRGGTTNRVQEEASCLLQDRCEGSSRQVVPVSGRLSRSRGGGRRPVSSEVDSNFCGLDWGCGFEVRGQSRGNSELEATLGILLFWRICQ